MCWNEDIVAGMATLEERLRTVVGQRRVAIGLSLAELGSRSGVSVSTLSRVETGGRKVTIELLEALAMPLETTVAALVAEASQEDRLLVPTPPVQLGSGLTGYLLRVEDDGRQLLRLTIPVRRSLPEPRTHPGREWFHVLRGRVRLRVGERELVLQPGQTVQFDTTRPHVFGAVGTPAEILSRFEPGAHRT
jgi:transcriptional regulator with XRE-family HTH domain